MDAHDLEGSAVFSGLRWIPKAGWRGRYINMRRFNGMFMVLLKLKDLLVLFVKSIEFLPGPEFPSPSRRDMTFAVESVVKPYPFLAHHHLR